MIHGLPHTTKLFSQARGPLVESVSMGSSREGLRSHATIYMQRTAGRVQLQNRSRRRVRCGLLLKLLLCGAACCRCGNKVPVLWALGHVAAPQAHPRHAYARTAQRAPVTSLDTLRMTAIKHTEQTHTRSERRSSSRGQHLAPSRWCSIVRIFTSLLVIYCCMQYSTFREFWLEFQNKMIFLGSRNQFQTRLYFGLESSLWFSTQP